MIKYKVLFIFCAAFIGGTELHSQNDSTLHAPHKVQLDVVEIRAERLQDFSAGSKILKIDSATLAEHQHQSLADVLSSESTLFIKTYGQGSLATSSFRGAGAAHTAVLWNGFNLNSSMNGVLDFSLVPIDFMNEIKIQYGGSSSLWGSGAVGGSIHLNFVPKFNEGFKSELALSGGSFGSVREKINLEWSGKKIVSKITFLNSKAQNDFTYINPYLSDSSEVRQNNAKVKTLGIINENHFKLAGKQSINVIAWLQETTREIPPTYFQNNSAAKQLDKFLKLSSQWNLNLKKLSLTARIGYFNEFLNYQDSSSNINSNNASQNLIGEMEGTWKINKGHKITGGWNQTYLWAKVDAYTSIAQQNKTSLFSAYQFQNSKQNFTLQLSARQEWMDGKRVPFVYSGGVNWKIFRLIETYIQAAKVYRLPNFNDRFWTPGGNPNLSPESGYSQEAGLRIKKHFLKNTIEFSWDGCIFNRNINDWIVWLPDPNGAPYWTPQNIMEVWSRGAETHTQLQYSIRKFKVQLSVNTNYVLSTNEKTLNANDESKGKQLLYVPMYSGNGKLQVSYANVGISYRHSYTGYRYTSSDNTEYLSPFDLGSLGLFYNKNYKKLMLTTFFQIENLWNKSYQLMEARPMPMRNYSLGINLSYHSPKSIHPNQ